MAGNILSPSAIWNGFSISQTPKAEILDVKKDEEISFTRLFIDGKEIDGEKVRILQRFFALFRLKMALKECMPQVGLLKE